MGCQPRIYASESIDRKDDAKSVCNHYYNYHGQAQILPIKETIQWWNDQHIAKTKESKAQLPLPQFRLLEHSVY